MSIDWNVIDAVEYQLQDGLADRVVIALGVEPDDVPAGVWDALFDEAYSILATKGTRYSLTVNELVHALTC